MRVITVHGPGELIGLSRDKTQANVAFLPSEVTSAFYEERMARLSRSHARHVAVFGTKKQGEGPLTPPPCFSAIIPYEDILEVIEDAGNIQRV